jgi:methylenetetrahydrofolate dehydrogenase (NADP+)/methenyltetrahydrofolate cyclohydrolase
MTAKIIDGKAIAAAVQEEVRAEAELLKTKYGITPGLATVLVGEDPASVSYVRSKQKTVEGLGMRSVGHHLPATASQAEVVELVRSLGADPTIHGILVQLPLPPHMDQETVLNTVPIEKDVDGFHPINIGRLSMKGRDPLFVPCTPLGCIVLLERTGVKIEGAEAVVVGRSNIVGLPVAMLLLHRNATMTICHSRTRDLGEVTRRADILLVAIGRPKFITADMVKPGVAIIDVGINRVEDPTKKSGYRLVGDVDFDAVKEVAGAITPVPGGVGPMTIAMLMNNTVTAAKRAAGLV